MSASRGTDYFEIQSVSCLGVLVRAMASERWSAICHGCGGQLHGGGYLGYPCATQRSGSALFPTVAATVSLDHRLMGESCRGQC